MESFLIINSSQNSRDMHQSVLTNHIQSNLGVVALFSVKNRTSEKNLLYGIFSRTTPCKISF